MRAVVDTNVLLSGLLWRGAPHTLLELARNGTVTFVSSRVLLAELAEVIERPKFRQALERAGVATASLLSELYRLVEIVDPPSLPAPVSNDRDDDAVLAVAVAARVDLVISGDNDLLSLQSYVGIPIIDPAAALMRAGAAN